jgi:hypothetical protein
VSFEEGFKENVSVIFAKAVVALNAYGYSVLQHSKYL